MERYDNHLLSMELENIYPSQTESLVVSSFLEGRSPQALSVLSGVVEETIGELFRPYALLTLRFKFAATLVKILKELSFFEAGMSASLPTLDFEVYKRSAKQLKSDLIQPFLILDEEPFKSAIERQKLVFKIKHYIIANIGADVSLQEVSEYVGLSPSYVSRIFPKQTGVNFKTFVNQSKVECAKQLLQSGLSITEVMKATGFLSRTTFNRTFGQYAGVSPSHYLQQNTKKGEKP